jgi:hypothetical protein
MAHCGTCGKFFKKCEHFNHSNVDKLFQLLNIDLRNIATFYSSAWSDADTLTSCKLLLADVNLLHRKNATLSAMYLENFSITLFFSHTVVFGKSC